ncbi:sensor histidine kinase [Amycolatopsis nigrescens]|uniref:sensor histidine kinase n=1 Tax=Amycolatopsis nigrescens TaxID=381445 RepID=UPI00316ABC2B
MVVVPSVILFVMWAVFSSYTVFDGFYVRAVAVGVREASIPAVNSFVAIQNERQLTMINLSRPAADTAMLRAQQAETDRAVREMRAALDSLSSSAPPEIQQRIQRINDLLAQLPQRRAQVEARSVPKNDVYGYYNGLVDAGTALFDTQARVVPDAPAGHAGVTAAELFRAADRMSRASSLASGALAAGQFTVDDHLAFAELVGAYRASLVSLVPVATDRVKDAYQGLRDGESWAKLSRFENQLITATPAPANPGRGGNNNPLPVSEVDWLSVSGQVSGSLIQLAKDQASDGADLGLQRGNDQFRQVIIGSLVALLVVIVGIVLAVRISRRLVNRALLTRLADLKDDALRMAHVQLPDIVERLRQGERVDVQAEVPSLHYGRDEIGQMADAFNAAQQTAVAAAVKESQAREGVNRVFLGIAHRNQGLVHRQLKILDRMEREEENPGNLDSLFQLDHLSTRARRNAENLIILAGEQPGRQWRKPVRLLDILRAAVAETEQYARVHVHPVPDVGLMGAAVADTIHLIAELVDNATSFSPPRSQVQVYTSIVGKGVVVEIEDQGLGMSADDRAQAQEMLANPPEFDAMAVRGDSRLGLFVVARLAQRRGIRVELRDSPQGGSKAMVYLPLSVVVTTVSEDTDFDTLTQLPKPRYRTGQTRQPSPGPRNRGDEPESAAAGWAAAGPETGRQDGEMDNPGGDGRSASGRAADDRPKLPRRRRQQHLAPQLYEESESTRSEHADEGARTAERVLDTVSAFQRGTRQARQADNRADNHADEHADTDRTANP